MTPQLSHLLAEIEISLSMRKYPHPSQSFGELLFLVSLPKTTHGKNRRIRIHRLAVDYFSWASTLSEPLRLRISGGGGEAFYLAKALRNTPGIAGRTARRFEKNYLAGIRKTLGRIDTSLDLTKHDYLYPDFLNGIGGLAFLIHRELPEAAVKGILYQMRRRAHEAEFGLEWLTPLGQITPAEKRRSPRVKLWRDTGMAHGMAGNLLLLSQLCSHYREARRLAVLSGNQMEFISLRPQFEQGIPKWAHLKTPPKPLQAWCYGDLGIGTAMVCSGLHLGKTSLTHQGATVLKRAAQGLTTVLPAESGLCHGLAGTLLLSRYASVFLESGGFSELSNSFAKLVEIQRTELLGRLFSRRLHPKTDGSFMLGLSGIALTLLAIEKKGFPDWGRLLSLNADPIKPTLNPGL